MVGQNDRSDRIDDERRDVLKGVTGLAAAGLLGGVSTGTAGAVGTSGWDWFGGLEHTALGSAEPYLENGSLVVSGIDSTGDSGVNVALGEAQGITVDTTLDWSKPIESYRDYRSTGIIGGSSGEDLGLLRTRRVDSPDGFELTPDFGGIGADTHTWEVYDQGELVGREEEVMDPSYIPDRDPEVEVKIIIIWTDAGPIIIIVIVGTSGPVVGPRMDDYIGNEIHLIPESPEVIPDAMTHLDVVGAGIDQFVIDGEAPHVLGNPHRQRGVGHLEPLEYGTDLGVSNLGESGDDGVAVELDGSQQFEATLSGLDLSPTDAFAGFDLTGTFDGTPDTALGSASLTNAGGYLDVQADFGSIGAGVKAEVFDAGEKVGETTVEAGTIGAIGDPTLVGWCGSDGDGMPDIIIIIVYDDDPLPHEFSDGSEFVGDELRLRPADLGGEVTGVSEYGIQAANVDSFGIVDEQF